jgi:hypothetical protein
MPHHVLVLPITQPHETGPRQARRDAQIHGGTLQRYLADSMCACKFLYFLIDVQVLADILFSLIEETNKN